MIFLQIAIRDMMEIATGDVRFFGRIPNDRHDEAAGIWRGIIFAAILIFGLEGGDDRFANLPPNLHHIHRVWELMKILIKLSDTFAGAVRPVVGGGGDGEAVLTAVLNADAPAPRPSPERGPRFKPAVRPFKYKYRLSGQLRLSRRGVSKALLRAANSRQRLPDFVRNGVTLLN